MKIRECRDVPSSMRGASMHQVRPYLIQPVLKFCQKSGECRWIDVSAYPLPGSNPVDAIRQPVLWQTFTRGVKKPHIQFSFGELLQKTPVVVGGVIGKI